MPPEPLREQELPQAEQREQEQEREQEPPRVALLEQEREPRVSAVRASARAVAAVAAYKRRRAGAICHR